MADEIKRLHYYDQQFLREPDFTEEQEYHMNMRRRHNSRLHGWGIVEGLQVVRKNDHEVTVAPGMAIDGDGREIVLFNEHDITLPSGVSEQGNRYYITIRYNLPEELTDPPPPEDMISEADRTRVTERPDFPAPIRDTDGVDDEKTTLILALITLANTGQAPILGQPNNDQRTYIPGVVPSGAIIIWTGEACPPGYERVTELDNKFLRGSSTYNDNAGGSNTHNHSISPHNHSIPSHNHSITGHTHSISGHTHSITAHNHSINGHTHTISSHNHWVPHVDSDGTWSTDPQVQNSKTISVHGSNGQNPTQIHSWHTHRSPGRNSNSTSLTTNSRSQSTNSSSLVTDSTSQSTNSKSMNANSTSLSTNNSSTLNTTSHSSLPVHATVLLCRKI